MKAIILAGGCGSRLWPLSNEKMPKQCLKIGTNQSLLQQTFMRVAAFLPFNNIVTITNAKFFQDIKLQLEQLANLSVVISEPAGKNTAPAIACALEYFRQKDNSDDIVIILPSDHLIKNVSAFQSTVESAITFAKQGYIVTFGIKPTYPETGYGYIKTKSKLLTGYKVEKFVEKPDIETAQNYLECGNYYWNSGVFMGKISTFMNEFEKYSPEIISQLKNLDFSNNTKIPYSIYEQMPSISIDYAIMEKSTKIALVELQSDWNDLGSWQSIYNIENKDKDGNVVLGNVITNNVKNSLIYSRKKFIAATDIKNLVIVETDDVILISSLNKSQNVKVLYEKYFINHNIN